MPEEVMIIAIVGIVFGTSLTGLVLYGIYNLIMAKMNKGKSGNSEMNPQFFRALSDFKKNTERRLENLESIVTDENQPVAEIGNASGTGSIEFEEDEVRSPEAGKKEEGGNLRNMLNE